MGYTDALNYLLFTNPIVTGATSYVKIALDATMPKAIKQTKEVTIPTPTMCISPIWKHAYSGQGFVRIAGLFGATAVALGAYGAHAMDTKAGDEELKKVFETANRYHFLHSLALLGVPLCRWPRTSGTFLVLGMLVFCGTCYHYALTGDRMFRKLTPIGGTMLIFGWLAMIL